ncbi:MAG: AI-2E family transporter, partial [Candidatus Gracilibacteria bacterium]
MKKIPSISMDSLKRLISSRPFRSKLPKAKEDALIIEKLPGYFLLLALAVAVYYLFGVLKPFLSVLIIAAVLSVAFYPMYRGLKNLFKGAGSLASLVSCLLVVVIIIVPLALFILMLTNEAFSTYQLIRFKVESGVFDQYLLWQDGGFFYDLKQRIDPFVDINALDMKKNVVDAAQNLSTFLFDQTANLLAGISSLLFNFGIMMFSMFYFFRDGDELIKRAGMMSPLPAAYEHELFRKIDSMVKAI